jgi:hypothetical protein
MPSQPELMLDSGAYSAWRRGEVIKVEAYIEFAKDFGHLFHSIANLDVIPGEFRQKKTHQEVERSAARSYENLQEMKAAGLSPIPVFHQGERFQHLDRLLDDGETYIGISPSGDKIQQDRRWLNTVFDRLTDVNGLPLVKTHGFGVTASHILQRYPWYSCDSASWVHASANGRIYLPHEVDPGVFDYSRQPRMVSIRELRETSPHLDSVIRFVEQEVGTDMIRMRYDTSVTREAVAVFFKQLAQHLPYASHRRTSAIYGDQARRSSTEWEKKKVIFAAGPITDRRHHTLNKLGIRERLLSYFDLRLNKPEDIEAYAKYGVAAPLPKLKGRRFKNWKRKNKEAMAYWNRRAIRLAEVHYNNIIED